MSVALGAWAGAVAWRDAFTRRIPGVLLLLAFLPALAVLLLTGTGVAGASWLSSLVGAGLAAAVFAPGWALGLAGAGDVKFAFVAGFVLGAARSIEMLLVAAVVLGAASAIVLLRSSRAAAGRRIAAGPGLAAGFIAELLAGPWLLIASG